MVAAACMREIDITPTMVIIANRIPRRQLQFNYQMQSGGMSNPSQARDTDIV